jgi:hypothetical protein
MSSDKKQNHSNNLQLAMTDYNNLSEEEIDNRELLALAKERSELIRSQKSCVYTWEEITAKHSL